jgi:transcriptional regulator with XRE-family HTH domain
MKRRKNRISGEQAVPHVRQFLGQRVRELRKQRGFSQERLGEQSSLSGRFVGEVEHGEKSISIDSLYKVSVSLGVPLGQLTNVGRSRRATVPSQDAEKIFALVSDRHPSAKPRRPTTCSARFSTVGRNPPAGGAASWSVPRSANGETGSRPYLASQRNSRTSAARSPESHNRTVLQFIADPLAQERAVERGPASGRAATFSELRGGQLRPSSSARPA